MQLWQSSKVRDKKRMHQPVATKFLWLLQRLTETRFSQLYSSNGELEHPSVKKGARTRDMTLPLLPHERPKWSLKASVLWLFKHHYPIPPSGQRHHGMPPSGMLVNGRMLVRSGLEMVLSDISEMEVLLGFLLPAKRGVEFEAREGYE